MKRKCLDCRGTGTDDSRIDRECHSCRGYGYIIEVDAEVASSKLQTLTIRVNANEHYLIKQAADASGMSINRWCKKILLAATVEVFFGSKNEKG